MPDLLRRRHTPRADAVVESLVLLGVPAERVQMIPVGTIESYKGEVVGQIPAPGTPLTPDSEIILFVSRLGLADRLPNDLLEPLPTARDEVSIEIEPGQSLDYWEREIRAQGNGRKLVSVIDRSLGYLHREIGRIEWALTGVSRELGFARRNLAFMLLGDVPLRDDEEVFLSSELQRLHDWVGTKGGIKTILEDFLGIPVTIIERRGPVLEFPRDECRPLGSSGCRLGGSLALGPRFVDHRPTLRIRLGPLSLAHFLALDRDSSWLEKLEALLTMVCPASCRLEHELELEGRDRMAVLGDPMRGSLGRTTYLAEGRC